MLPVGHFNYNGRGDWNTFGPLFRPVFILAGSYVFLKKTEVNQNVGAFHHVHSHSSTNSVFVLRWTSAVPLLGELFI